MTEQEIIEGNKLIAEFMGGKWPERINHEVFKSLNNDLGFHNSWDWLMPVVEKIEIFGFEIWIKPHNSCYIYAYPDIQLSKIINKDSKIESVYKAVIEFLTHYNRNNNERNKIR